MPSRRLGLVALPLLAACAVDAPRRTGGAEPSVTAPEPSGSSPTPTEPPRRALRAFASTAELDAFLAEQVKRPGRAQGGLAEGAVASAPAAAPAQDAKGDAVTNVQTAGVDEGGIVKVSGDHLVVLRRGRLFTVRVGDLAPVAAVDAFGPGIDPKAAWYDELLVSGGTVAVVGYSYARGGTEVGLFDLDGDGKLSHRSTFHLRSNDYYSSRNYASRLVGSKLVFYTPLHLHGARAEGSLPAMRRWTGSASGAFQTIASPSRVYRPIDDFGAQAAHTVTTCDLAQREPTCEATSVLGPHGRVFYASQDAVYVWMTDHRWQPSLLGRGGTSTTRSALVRMPLSGGAPTAIRVSGAPIDQFSFLEENGHLDVLVRGEGGGDAMWSPEHTAGDVSMLRVPLSLFSGDVPAAPKDAYAALPKPQGFVAQNRFVGDWLLYGSGVSWGHRPHGTSGSEGEVFAYRYARGGSARALPLGHTVDRIEALGANALVVGGSGSDLVFSSLDLEGDPRVAGKLVRANAAQGETRSHGFFYRSDGAGEGLLGLPIRSSGGAGAAQLTQGSASVVFLENRRLALREIGELAAQPQSARDDACKASCVDWYGNARPLFLRGRLLALMGYELVEGELRGGRVEETRRVSFAPR